MDTYGTEAKLAPILRARTTTTHAPFDLLSERWPAVIEVKTYKGKSQQVIMNKRARERKQQYVEAHGVQSFTVVVQHVGTRIRYYVCEGFGGFSIPGMTEVKTPAAIRRYIDGRMEHYGYQPN